MRLAVAALLLLAARAPQDDVVKKVVPDADRIKKLARKLSPASREKIEKALGEKLAEAELASPLWECYATVPSVSSMEKTRCLVTVVTVRGPKGVFKVGVAAATLENTLHTVKILENADEKALESKSFLSQFDGFEYTTNVWNSPDALAGALRKAQGGDDAARETDAIVRLNSHMRAMGPAWERLLEKVDKKDKTATEETASMDRAFEDSLRLLPAAKFLKAAQQDRYKQYAQGARTDFADLKRLLEGGKFDDAYRKTGEIDSQRCAKCHGSYRRNFREARLERGLGDGYFSTKLEVSVPDPRLEASYQAAASAVRRAILIASEMK
jgi:hypothetical protein